MKKQKLGFSLLEIAVVILIIGILVAGISKGTEILDKAKLGNAQSITKSSPVALIPDLAAWYETTLVDSFKDGEGFNGEAVTTWRDVSPRKTNDATGGTALYTDSGINGLPSLVFDGDDEFTFKAGSLINNDYTVIVVEKIADGVVAGADGSNYFLKLGGDTAENVFGYETLTGATTMESSENSGTAPAITTTVKRIVMFTGIETTTGTTASDIYIDGVVVGTTDTDGAPLENGNGRVGYIGSGNGADFYEGEISEVILYKRVLDVEELNEIHDYLSNKYDIDVTEIS